MRGNFGYSNEGGLPQARLVGVKDQAESLKMLAEMAQRATVDPLVRNTAIKIVADCASREDECELRAIFNAVKYGSDDVEPLKNGFKYIADPRFADYFASPIDILNNCIKGACGGDCDEHCALIVSLAGALGWRAGLRAWGRRGSTGFVHVYPVVAYPKRPPFTRAVALDTTVPESSVGWEPPRGEVLTAWLE